MEKETTLEGMTVETMNLHRALIEKKNLTNKINDLMLGMSFIAVEKENENKIKGMDRKEYEKKLVSEYDKITAWMKRLEAINSAVIKANSENFVTIAGKEYTIAEAISFKQNFIYQKTEFLKQMRSAYRRAEQNLTEKNKFLTDEKVDGYVTNILRDKESIKDAALVQSLRDNYIREHTYTLINPLNLLEKIEDLEKEVLDFSNEVDAVLSTKNATVEITISYKA